MAFWSPWVPGSLALGLSAAPAPETSQSEGEEVGLQTRPFVVVFC